MRSLIQSSFRSSGVILGLLLLLPGLVAGQPVLVDDFDDGNTAGWSHYDTTGLGTFDATSGELIGSTPVVASGRLISIYDPSPSNPVTTDGFVRARLRVDVPGASVMVGLRASSGVGGSGYASYEGFASTNSGTFGLAISGTTLLGALNPAEYPFVVGETWNVELGCVGNQISLRVWPDGSPEPETPQLIVYDDTLTSGGLGLISRKSVSGSAAISTAHDDVYFTPSSPDPVYPFPGFDPADALVVDDFSDGMDDGWVHGGSLPGLSDANFDAGTGEYAFNSNAIIPAGQLPNIWSRCQATSGAPFTEGFVQVKARALNDSTNLWLGMRTSDNELYLALIAPVIDRLMIQTFINGDVVSRVQIDIDFSPGEDWNLQLGCVGNQISCRAWRVGDPEPEAPQLTLLDSTFDNTVMHPDGTVILGATHEGPAAAIEAVFDDLIYLPPTSGLEFTRGDIDGDGIFNALTDALSLLSFGFIAGSAAPPCMAAADTDGDLIVNALVDGLYTLAFGFVPGSPPPPAPYPACGSDPATTEALGCDAPSCP